MQLVQLLTQAGVLSWQQAEEARQQQIVYGDRIGTNLLACGFMRETMLAQALGALHGVPYAAGKDADSRPAFTRGIHRSMAEALRAVPVRVDDDVAWVFMVDPHDHAARGQLAEQLQKEVRPVVVCEARMWWLLHKFYMTHKGTRLLALDDPDRTPRHRILPRSQTRATSIYSQEADAVSLLDDPTAPVSVQPYAWLSTLPSTPVGMAVPSATSQLPQPALTSPASLSSSPWDSVPPTSPNASGHGNAIAMSALHGYAANELSQHAQAFENVDAELLEELEPVDEAPPLVAGALIVERDTSPLTFAQAKEMLATARDRNEIALFVLRSCLSTFKRAILLTVQRDMALGWDAVGDGLDAVDVKAIWLPLKQPSIFKLARDSNAHFLGPLPKEKTNILFLKQTGAQIPKSALVVPIIVRGRVVNLLYCDNGKGQHVSTDIGDMLVIAQHINRSYESLLVKK